MPGSTAGRARQQRLQPCSCSSRGASAGAFVVGAETRKAMCVGCDAVVYVVVSMHVSMRISAHVVCISYFFTAPDESLATAFTPRRTHE